MSKSAHIVSLTGGLGNQLFQLAAALNLFNSDEIKLSSNYGNPRPLSKDGADIYLFSLPKNIRILRNRRTSIFAKKCIGYNLRIGISPKKYEEFKLYKWSIELISKVLIFFDQFKYFQFIIGSGVGFCEIPQVQKSSLLVGYFQSYKWVSNPRVKFAMGDMHPIYESDLLRSLIKRALSEKLLFVHIRLTDYRHEDNFGLLSKEYYRKAITNLMQTGAYSEIWLFSDELELAKSYVPDQYKDLVELIPEIDNSPAQTLELLRYGSGYIIANSSFSWWGAMLAFKENVRVVAPSVWFKNLESPKDLIPPSWETIEPW